MHDYKRLPPSWKHTVPNCRLISFSRNPSDKHIHYTGKRRGKLFAVCHRHGRTWGCIGLVSDSHIPPKYTSAGLKRHTIKSGEVDTVDCLPEVPFWRDFRCVCDVVFRRISSFRSTASRPQMYSTVQTAVADRLWSFGRVPGMSNG